MVAVARWVAKWSRGSDPGTKRANDSHHNGKKARGTSMEVGVDTESG